MDLYANGRLEGGIKVAGTGFVKGVGTISPMLECNDPITCSVALLFFVTAGAVGATVGAVTGAVDSPAGGKVDKVEEVLEEKITSQVSQMTLAGLLSEKVAQNPMIDFELVPIEGRATMLSTSDYEALRDKGFHELLRVNLTQIEFEGGRGKDPLVTLRLKAVIEIVDLDRPQNIIKRKFVQVGPSFYLDGWSAKPPEAVKGYFESVLQQIAADMYHQVFVQFDLHIPPRVDSGPGSATYGCCWICPDDPPLEYSFQRMKIEYPVVESVRPTLKWFYFPSPNQAEQFKKNLQAEKFKMSTMI